MRPRKVVTPDLFIDTLTAYQNSAALKTAVELDIFSHVAQGIDTPPKLAQKCGTSGRGMRMLCDAMAVLGFLYKRTDNYLLTDVSKKFLNRESPDYFGGAVEWMMSDRMIEGYSRLTEAVIKGGTVLEDSSSLDPENPMWVRFAKLMGPMVAPFAEAAANKIEMDTARPLRVLDIAAGHGLYGIAAGRKYPNAQIYALDWKNVLEVARENAERAGVTSRYHTIEGSAFDVDLGDNWDVILITNFLHHFDFDTNVGLLRKVIAGLNRDGRVITVDFMPAMSRITGKRESLFALTMLVGTPSGDAYTFQELAQMFAKVGFGKSEHFPIKGTPQHIMVSIF